MPPAVRARTRRRSGSALLVALSISAGALASGCASQETNAGGRAAADAVTFTARITRVGEFGYALVPESDPGTRYAPDRLAPEFEVEGLRVTVTGRIGPADDQPLGSGAGRRWGTPFTVLSIEPAAEAPGSASPGPPGGGAA